MLDRELKNLLRMNIFIVKIYLKYWYRSSNPSIAPIIDLNLIKDLIKFKEIDSIVAEEVLKTMKRHLWYLSETLVGLAFFDRTIDDEEKRKMVLSLAKPGHPENPKRICLNLSDVDIQIQQISHFVSENTMLFFPRYLTHLRYLPVL